MDSQRINSKTALDDCQLMCLSDHVLTQGDSDVLKPPYKSFEHMPGYNVVQKGLQDLDIKIGNGTQLHAASNIFAGNNCFIIGSENPRAGKSLSYMIPVISKLICDVPINQKIIGSGPLCLIICGTNKSGHKLDGILEKLTRRYNRSTINAAFLEKNDPSTANYSSKNGKVEKYDVILATAECVVEMLEQEHSYFSYDRLSYLIFDDAHIILKYKQTEFKKIIDGFKNYIKRAGARNCSLQTIFCGNEWSDEIENSFSSIVEYPVLIIGSPVAIMAYNKFNVKLVKPEIDGPFASFKTILNQHTDMKKIVVVAAELETLKILASECQTEKIHVKFFGEGNIGSKDLAETKWEWETASKIDNRVIILTTDRTIRELNISSAYLLIHYDVPKLKTFAVRFSSLWSHSRDLTKEQQPNDELPCNKGVLSYVILPPNLPNEHRIVLKLQKLGVYIPEDVIQKAQEVKEHHMESIELCPGIKCNGKCLKFDVVDCNYRHYFIEQDILTPSILPRTGQVELRIKELITPNLYRAQIIRYAERDQKTNKIIHIKNYEDEIISRSLQLKNLVTEEPKSFTPGTQIVIMTRENTENRFIYTRGEIKEVVTRNQFGFPTAVSVYCYDIGETRTVKVNEDDERVFAIPTEMENLYRCSVEVVLANTAPPLGELEFRVSSLSSAKDLFKKTGVLEADIALSIQNTIWVKRLVQRKKLPTGIIIETWDATSKLAEKQILVRNPNHLGHLYKLCEKVKFSCDIYRKVDCESWKKEKEFLRYFYQSKNISECKWAYLPLCRDEKPTSTSAETKCISTSGQIHITISRFYDQVIKLEDEMDEEIRMLKRNRDYNLEENFYKFYEKGMIVATLTEFDEIYHRGLITEVLGSHDSKWTFKVSLLDLGGEGIVQMSHLFPIPIKFVTKLPFQVININLAHIHPRRRKSSTQNRFTDHLRDFLIPQGETFEVEVVALEKVGTDSIHGCNSYNGFIFGETQEIGEKLVEDNFATFVTSDWPDRIKYIKTSLLEQLNQKFNALVKSPEENDDDEDVEGDDEDFNVNFNYPLEDLAKIIFGTNSDNESESYIEVIEDGDNEPGPSKNSKDNDSKGQSKALEEFPVANSSTVNGIIKNQNEKTIDDKFTPSQVERQSLPKSVTKVPRVDWYEKNNNLFLKVRIVGIKEYGCIVGQDKRELHFKTIDPPNYEFNLKLYKKVNENPVVRVFGQYCEIKLSKRLRDIKWIDDKQHPVITPTKGLHWLKYDVDAVVNEEVDEVETKEMRILIPVDYEKIQDDEDSDDEILDTVEGVKEEEMHVA